MLMIKIGLIGYGYWGKKVLGYFQESLKFDLIYVHLRSLKGLSRKKIIRDWGTEFVADINVIWDDNSLKNIFVATPIDSHFDLVRTALLNRKNVLVEKPLCRKIEEAEQIRQLAERYDLKILTDYIYTFSPGLLKAKELIGKGEIGELRAIHMYLQQLGRFLECDVYTLLGSHCLAILDMFCPINSVTFEKNDMMKTNGFVSSGTIQFESMDSGVKGFIYVSLNCPQRSKKVIFYGENGTLIYDPLSKKSLMIFMYKKEKLLTADKLLTRKANYRYDEDNNLRCLIDTFYRVITGQKPDNLQRAMAVTEILEKL